MVVVRVSMWVGVGGVLAVAKGHGVLHESVGELLQFGQAKGGRWLPIGGAIVTMRGNAFV